MTSIDGIYPNRLNRRKPLNYQENGQSLPNWRAKAQTLFEAAQSTYAWYVKSREAGRVKSQTWVEAVYKYLAGMAIENLLKAVMIGKDKSLVGECELLKSITNHTVWTNQKNDKLRFLRESKSLQDNERLTDDEKEFLSLVERYVVWVGRYPIPTKQSAYIDDLDTIEKFEQSHPDVKDFDKLFQSTYGKLMQLSARIDNENMARDSRPT
jgi:hypothetical protein